MTAPRLQNTISDTLLNAGRDNNVTNAYNHYGNNLNVFTAPDPLAGLQQRCALGALHDAAERPDPPKCHENTRVAVLDRIDRWARDKSVDAKPILWLSGAAGAGKSAIAQTSIERWREEKLIVPNFFLWRTAAERNQKTHVLPTIAFQLTKLLPTTKPIIKEAVRDGSVFKQNLRAQVEALIINPLRANSHSVIIVLDGLDECCVSIPRAGSFPGQHFEDQQREILEAIAFACQEVPSLRVLVASRPERQIRQSFAGKQLSTLLLSLSLSHEHDSAADIELYLDCSFAEIRSKHPGVNPLWPSKEQLDELVEKSSGQFIYPSTVIQYVSRPRRHPVISLEEVLALRPRSEKEGGHPLAELDALYTLALESVSKDSLPTVMTILGLMVFFRDSILDIFLTNKPGYNTIHLEKFLFLQEGELFVHLTDLHSILSISKNAEDGPTEIGFFHATLSEYLTDESRSGSFSINMEDTSLQLSLLLLRHASGKQPPNASVYNLSELYVDLASFAGGSPPSKDLMKGLWNLLKDEIGEYSLVSDSNPNSKTFQGDKPKYFQGAISVYLHRREQHRLLRYLQKCNIATIEPSTSRRYAVDAHLRYLGKVVDPDGGGARWVGQRDEKTETNTVKTPESRLSSCKDIGPSRQDSTQCHDDQKVEDFLGERHFKSAIGRLFSFNSRSKEKRRRKKTEQ